MPILNEGITFDQLPANNRAPFVGRGTPRLFPVGWEFYKYTKYPLAAVGPVSPWWSSVKPLDVNDPGLEGSLQRAGRLGVDPQRFARARAAVTQQWNSMDHLLRIRLVRPVYGLVGRCSAQLVDDTLQTQAEKDENRKKVVFIGGAWQAFIPGLTRDCVAPA